MTDVLISDGEFDAMRTAPKRVTNPQARGREKPGGHKQRNFNLIAEHDDAKRFRLYLRQNLDDEQDFSCGLALIRLGGRSVSLVRYNGSSHRHGDILFHCHIHRATEEASLAGKKIDSHAEATDRYRTLNGALACLIDDCCVDGISASHDTRDLFDDH